uniref:AB hydrolase-1 domain-containing protein n=1 Tax=Octactis speculum TaxID=3111310 RepID=A0A7S2G9D9_9STRA
MTPPALVLVHGFGSSSDQWRRLVKSIQWKQAYEPNGTLNGPRTIVAVDILGFGNSEKPGVSYTQHLWEAQIGDFVLEVLRGRPFVIAGNSIGGGLSCGVASNLKDLCRGLILCNTAGVILEPSEYAAQAAATGKSVGEQTRGGAAGLGVYYKGVPGGQALLDGFGSGLIGLLKPQIPDLLKKCYPTNPDSADSAQALHIARGASDPGADNVIGSGQKLPPQRPLNEVLGAACNQHPPISAFTGPVLVTQGVLDPLTGPELAAQRAEQLGVLRDDVTVERLQAGHCPHDELPDDVASAVVRWWPQVL